MGAGIVAAGAAAGPRRRAGAGKPRGCWRDDVADHDRADIGAIAGVPDGDGEAAGLAGDASRPVGGLADRKVGGLRQRRRGRRRFDFLRAFDGDGADVTVVLRPLVLHGAVRPDHLLGMGDGVVGEVGRDVDDELEVGGATWLDVEPDAVAGIGAAAGDAAGEPRRLAADAGDRHGRREAAAEAGAAEEGEEPLVVDLDVERAARSALTGRRTPRREVGERHEGGGAILVVEREDVGGARVDAGAIGERRTGVAGRNEEVDIDPKAAAGR